LGSFRGWSDSAGLTKKYASVCRILKVLENSGIHFGFFSALNAQSKAGPGACCKNCKQFLQRAAENSHSEFSELGFCVAGF